MSVNFIFVTILVTIVLLSVVSNYIDFDEESTYDQLEEHELYLPQPELKNDTASLPQGDILHNKARHKEQHQQRNDFAEKTQDQQKQKSFIPADNDKNSTGLINYSFRRLVLMRDKQLII
eukprot:TRINITY_DN351_c0_g2_i2.p4 TRINITY_DN351_c0_g2~~TRINITY_DN351_c0_g2_i2.p4  ORF type:complete len:120 (+),score=2.03 TRINITY_DN351_c0_g2_i2:128-487(+)